MQEDSWTRKIVEYGIEEKLLVPTRPYAFTLIGWVKIELVATV